MGARRSTAPPDRLRRRDARLSARLLSRAGARLALSSRLPFRLTADLIDVAAGTHAGDPVYLLGQGVSENVHGLLYRSSDGGKSWQRLPAGEPAAGMLPSAAPRSHAAGALYVPRAHHSVAAPFVATYRRMSPLILGDPVTEAYTRGTTLTQDFDHLRLERHPENHDPRYAILLGLLGKEWWRAL